MQTPKNYNHIVALLTALIIVCVSIGAGWFYAQTYINENIHNTDKHFWDVKLHGTSMLDASMNRRDMLTIFGSSEFLADLPFRGVDFFRENYNGFTLYPIGKAGSTCLAIIQKIGSLEKGIAQDQVVISLSPSFFLTNVSDDYIVGNSSVLQIQSLLYNAHINNSLKRKICFELLKYDKIFTDDVLFKRFLQAFIKDRVSDKIFYYSLSPCMFIEHKTRLIQDVFESYFQMSEHEQVPSNITQKLARIAWDKLFHQAVKCSKPLVLSVNRHINDNDFLNGMQTSREWNHLELLLQVLEQRNLKTLVLCMPLHATLLKAQGVTTQALKQFDDKMNSILRSHNITFKYFKEYEEDPLFFIDNNDHLSSQGWMLYNKEIYMFYNR